jgi:hypothetical protein
MDKEMKKVVKFALSKGFVQVKSNGHIMLKYGGRRVSLSSSPSQPDIAARNAMKDVIRLLRMCA